MTYLTGERTRQVLGNSRLQWSSLHMADGIKLDRALTSAIRTEFWQVGSVRAAAPLPMQGQTYFEITIKRYGKYQGQALNGFYFVGVCDGEVDIWDGTWWEDDRASSIWALRSETSNEEHVGKAGSKTHAELCGLGCERRIEWAPGTSFGHGDVIGVYIDLDESKMWLYRNQELLDELPAFRNLPHKEEIFPFCTMFLTFHPLAKANYLTGGTSQQMQASFSVCWLMDMAPMLK